MGRDLSNKREAEMKELRDWCVAILQFMARIDPSSGVYAQGEQAVEAALQRGNHRGLKMVARDVREWAAALSPGDRHDLDEALRSRFGRGLAEEADDVREQIERILQRAHINTQDEYHLLLHRADEIAADETKRIELSRITELLVAYEAD